jgi:hypothetical protein
MFAFFRSIVRALNDDGPSESDLAVAAAIRDWEYTTNQAAMLIKAIDEAEIAELERQFGLTQSSAVTHFIEQTEWGLEAFPEFQDRKGTPDERLEVLRARWKEWEELE